LIPIIASCNGIRVVGHRDNISKRDDDLIRPGALLVVGNDQDPLTLQGGIDLRSRFRHAADAFRTEREWEGRPERIHATDEQKVRGIERRCFHRDQHILGAEGWFGKDIELDDIRRFAKSHQLQLPHEKLL